MFETLIGKKQQLMLATQVCKMILKVGDAAQSSAAQRNTAWHSRVATALLGWLVAFGWHSAHPSFKHFPAHACLLVAPCFPFADRRCDQASRVRVRAATSCGAAGSSPEQGSSVCEGRPSLPHVQHTATVTHLGCRQVNVILRQSGHKEHKCQPLRA